MQSTEQDFIDSEFLETYRTLLGLEMEVENEYIRKLLSLMPKLEDDVREGFEALITMEEVGQATDDLQTGMVPGPDGIGGGFCKTFKKEMSEMLHRVLMEAYDVKQLPPSFRASHVIFITKTEYAEKLKSVENYRPISLTNVAPPRWSIGYGTRLLIRG